MFEEKMEILRGIVKAGYPCSEANSKNMVLLLRKIS